MKGDGITLRTLTDGGQAAAEVADLLAAFLGAASSSLDVAAYDFHLRPETAAVVGGAIRNAARRGVRVRLLYNVDHANPVPVPPPPEPDARLIASLDVPAHAVAGIPDLMHHKYAVRDGDEVWSGSTNWTDESWSRQENVIARVTSRALAERFTRNFDELWETGIVELSGRVDPVRVDVGGTRVRAWFTPGYGDALSHRIGKRIGRAARRVRVCSPVITAAPVLAALAQVNSERNVDLAGCVDATQVADVIRQWHANGNAAWKLPLLERALADRFSAKRSTPWSQESLHDFMHAKVTVADDVVFVGSFNLSRSGEKNAENTLEIENAALADTLAAYVDEVRERYPRLEL